jgi:hypothetical protein
MTLFEYLAIAFSIVFSLSATRLLGGLSHVVQPGRRYWVHVTAVCGWLLATIGVFWIFWSYRSATWTLPRFLLVLGSPGLIYFNACTLVPDNPSAIESWRAYYYSIRRRYFLGVLCWALVVTTSATVVLEMPWTHPARLFNGLFIAAGIVGATFSSERVHAGIALSIMAFGLIAGFAIGTQPGSLAP